MPCGKTGLASRALGRNVERRAAAPTQLVFACRDRVSTCVRRRRRVQIRHHPPDGGAYHSPAEWPRWPDSQRLDRT